MKTRVHSVGPRRDTLGTRFTQGAFPGDFERCVNRFSGPLDCPSSAPRRWRRRCARRALLHDRPVTAGCHRRDAARLSHRSSITNCVSCLPVTRSSQANVGRLDDRRFAHCLARSWGGIAVASFVALLGSANAFAPCGTRRRRLSPNQTTRRIERIGNIQRTHVV